MAKRSDPLLDLTTGFKRPTVKLDSGNYDMRHPDELSMPDLYVLSRAQQELGSSLQDAESEDRRDDIGKVSKVILELIMPDVPEKARNEISATQLLAAIEFFTALSPKLQAAVEDERATPPKS